MVATGSSLVIGHYFGAFLGTGVIQSVEKITNYAIIVAKKHVKRVIYLIWSRIPDPVAEPMMQMGSFIGLESIDELIELVLLVECVLFFYYILIWCCCCRRGRY